MRIFSTQLMLYLKASCQITDYTYKWSSFMQGEVLRNHTIDHRASSIDFNCVQTPLSLINRDIPVLLRKVHPHTHVFASIECLKRNRTSRILSGQV